MSEIAFLGAAELARRIAAKELSASELLQVYLERVDRYNEALNAIVVEDRETATQRAASLDNTTSAAPFHGVPMTIKESFNVTGMPTTWGNPDWADNVAEEDAEAVKVFNGLGVNLFGKTNVPLALADFQSYNDVYGTTGNPYDHSRTPGGSSGGSAAALAAGLTGIEAGSDIGGSIRNPAHFCGVFGHKPTWNLLWMRGHAPPGDMRSTPDISVIGPMARTAEDLDIALRALAGPDEIAARGVKLDLPSLEGRSVSDLKIAVWSDDVMCPVSVEVRKRVELVADALRELGATVHDDARPTFSSEHSHDTYERLLHATMASRMPDADYESLKKYVASLNPEDDSRGARVFRAQVSSFKDWGEANELRHQLRWTWHEFFKDYDLLISPIMPTAAFPHDQAPFSARKLRVDNEDRPYFQQVFWAGLTGVSYLPSTVIPTGLNEDGLPIGIQIVAPEYGDLLSIGAAAALEGQGFRFVPPSAYVE